MASRPTPKTHTFVSLDGRSGRHKRKYLVNADRHLDGYCHLPEKRATYEIYVDPSTTPLNHLETTLHEAIHACLPKWNENQVEWLGKELAKFAWRMGYGGS